jgi:copper chaperone CopZ
MKELTVVFDTVGHKELEGYLLTVKGIKEAKVTNEKMVEIYVKYDPKETNTTIIKTEIYIFLDIANTPNMYSFDKHEKNMKKCEVSKTSVCCEYCYMGFIEDLYDMEGITKAESNFTDFFVNQVNPVTIKVEYNPELLTEEEVIEKLNSLYE